MIGAWDSGLPLHDACGWSRVSEKLGRLDSVKPRGSGLVLRATCPRCHGKTAKRVPAILPGHKGTGNDPQEPPGQDTAVERSWMFFCECGQSHPGRPETENRHGCGASWWVAP